LGSDGPKKEEEREKGLFDDAYSGGEKKKGGNLVNTLSLGGERREGREGVRKK